MQLGVALIKSPKIIFARTLLILVDVQGIYVDKIDPNFYKNKLTWKCPVGCVNKNSAYFVSDWTGDSHLTHYFTSKTMGF
jgi:hypothetical protein